MRDDRDTFDPFADFTTSWSPTQARRTPAMPLRIRLVLAGLASLGAVAMVMAALLVRC